MILHSARRPSSRIRHPLRKLDNRASKDHKPVSRPNTDQIARTRRTSCRASSTASVQCSRRRPGRAVQLERPVQSCIRGRCTRTLGHRGVRSHGCPGRCNPPATCSRPRGSSPYTRHTRSRRLARKSITQPALVSWCMWCRPRVNAVVSGYFEHKSWDLQYKEECVSPLYYAPSFSSALHAAMTAAEVVQRTPRRMFRPRSRFQGQHPRRASAARCWRA